MTTEAAPEVLKKSTDSIWARPVYKGTDLSYTPRGSAHQIQSRVGDKRIDYRAPVAIQCNIERPSGS